MPDDAKWEMVGYGTPTPFLDASHMFTGDDPGWHNMEKGAEPPTDADILEASDAVYKDDNGKYYTVSLDFIYDLETLEHYVDDVYSQQYE